MDNNREEYKFLVSDQSIPETYKGFQEQLNVWFSNGRCYQFLVYSKNGNELIGTLYFYNHNCAASTVKMSVFFARKNRGQAAVAEALGLGVSFAKHILHIQQILFAVYVENEVMQKIAMKLLGHLGDQASSFCNTERTVTCYTLSTKHIDSIISKIDRLHR